LTDKMRIILPLLCLCAFLCFVSTRHLLLDVLLKDAVRTNNLQLTGKLLGWGANVNVIVDDNLDSTALIFASLYGYKDMVEMLLRNGAAVNRSDRNGSTALIGSAWAGNADVIRILLKNEANLNARHNNGRTALWFALTQHHKEAVNILKDYGTRDLGNGESLQGSGGR